MPAPRQPLGGRVMSALHAMPPLLHDRHATELYDGSGIDPAIVARRGCFSADAEQLRGLGFADWQCLPGLVLPQWTLAGVQRNYHLKADDPRRDDDGDPIKYEAVFGSRPHFDIHPDALDLLRDETVTLHITEGIKKGDAGWSHGLLCVAIPGVWQFLNGRLVVPDLDEIPLVGRRVRVVFDSDVTRKPAVAEAMLRLCAVLDRRGANVELIYLPEDGAKVGLDDYFVAGGTVEGLDALAKPWDGKGPGIWLQEST